MQGSDVIWLVSIVLGMTLIGWLVLDWLESAQGWDERVDMDAGATPYMTGSQVGRSEQYPPDPLDAELELMLCYPLDPFAPALLWRPLPQDQWIEVQEASSDSVAALADVEEPEADAPAQSVA